MCYASPQFIIPLGDACRCGPSFEHKGISFTQQGFKIIKLVLYFNLP